MKLTVVITANKEGVTCSADIEGAEDFSSPEINLMSVGALEVARASLLARRWGVDIAGMKEVTPIVKQPSKRQTRRT